MKYILTAIYMALTTGGLFFLKLGGDSLALSFKDGISLKVGFLTTIGLLFYVCSFLLWQKLLATYDLSYIVPLTTGIIQVIVILLGCFFFKESISISHMVGVILVIIGVVLISIKR